jgi:hypothetical protein
LAQPQLGWILADLFQEYMGIVILIVVVLLTLVSFGMLLVHLILLEVVA